LGLATGYGVVKQSGGFIWLSSEIGRGTTFEIFFPRVHARVEDLSSDSGRILPAKGSEKILLVEDDEALRALILSSLRDWGYTVIEATDGLDGLRIAHCEAGAIDLVLTDVVMPGMSEPKMADEISALHPETQILYMSGYSDFGGGQQEILRQGRTLLQKPFELRSLARQVREVLENPRKVSIPHS
jgi:DNA-binding NtrC family response regulator